MLGCMKEDRRVVARRIEGNNENRSTAEKQQIGGNFEPSNGLAIGRMSFASSTSKALKSEMIVLERIAEVPPNRKLPWLVSQFVVSRSGPKEERSIFRDLEAA